MADRPVDDNNEDPGRISDDPSLICSGSSSRMSPSGTPDVKSDGKRKKFRPLDAVRKLFKRRPKLKEIDSARARSTSALYGHVSGDGEEDEEGGFLSRMSLRKNKSRSEDSVLVEARTNQGGGILRKLAYSVEGINRSLYSSNSGKSSSRNSLNSTESQDLFKEGFQGQKSAVEHSEACVDFEVVAKTEALNTDAAKFKISVRPKGRKGSRQNRKNRQKLASNLPCLNEEQQIISNPSLNEDESEEMAAEVEREKLVLNEEGEISLEHLAKHKKESKMQVRVSVRDLRSKPRPKSTPVTIHSTPETKPQRINAILDLESGERPKHFPNPELLEFGKIRSKSLDIEGRVPKSSDLGLSPVRKLNVARKVSKDDKDTRKKSPSGGKSPETNNGELLSANTKSDIGKLYQLDLKKINLEPGSIKFSGSCEKDLDVGLDSQKRPLSPDIGDKNLKPMKSPLRSDFGLRFKQNPDNEENVPTPIRSPVKSIDLGLWSTKGPIQTPSLESKPLKPLSPTRGSNVELKSISSTPETAEEMKSPKSLKHFELALKPLKSPVYGPDSSPLSGSRSLQSPVKQTQNVELSCPKGRNKSNDMEEKTRSVSELQESVQKLGKNSEQSQSLQERRLERSDHPNTVQAPTKNKESDEIKTLQLPAPNNEIKDQPKSPKKIFANLELNNLTTKPFRSFSDPKSPRSTLRSTNLSPRSPNLSPRSPILPPKPIRSPVGSLDAKSPTKDFELPKLGLKCDNISDSSENLFSKLPLSPSVSPKTFTVMSQSLKSPTDDKGLYNVSTSVRKPLKELSQVKAQKSPSSDNLCFSDVTQKPLKKVSAGQGLEQKMANRSPLTSPKSEDASENPLLKSINFEPKSQKSSDSTKEVLLKPVKFESKPLKKTNMDDVIPVKKSFEKPNLCPKPLKSHSEASNSGSKLNLASTKLNESDESETEVEEAKSQVGKNREIFRALRNKESNVSVTPKMATGSSRVSAFVNKTDSFISSSNTDEKSKMPDKQNIFSTSVMTNKIKTSDSFKSADSSSISPTTPKVANTFKIDDVSDLNGKSKMALGGYKTVQASSSDKSKTAFTSKPSFSSKIATETSKATESSTTSSRRDPEPNLPSTPKGADSCQLSESPKVIATPKKLDSSKSPKETSPDKDDIVATICKITAADSDTKVTPDPEKPKPFGLTSAASSENVATGIDVSQNNTNRLSALFEARNVTASHVDPPGTTVKIEVIAKEDSDGQKPVKLREKGKSTEKISELSSRQSKVLDLVKNFQKLQAT